jgi:hypothetical protein
LEKHNHPGLNNLRKVVITISTGRSNAHKDGCTDRINNIGLPIDRHSPVSTVHHSTTLSEGILGACTEKPRIRRLSRDDKTHMSTF